MRFKMALCQVLCLVITAILHSSTADNDSVSMELVNYKMEKFVQSIMEKLYSHLDHYKSPGDQEEAYKNGFHFDSISIEALINNTVEKFERKIEKFAVQNQEIIEKLAAYTTNVQQMAESIKIFRNITDNLLAGQQDIQIHLTSVTNDLRQQKNELRNITNVQHKEVMDTLTAQAEFVKILGITSDNILEGQSNIGKQLANVNNELYWNVPTSCATLKTNASSNIFYIRPAGAVEKPFLVLCDFEDNYNLGGGWTVFQKRFDETVDFEQNWEAYKNGFGDVNGEHWLGLEKLHLMTRSGRHELLIILEDDEGESAYALYDRFQIGSEAEKYKLTVGSYSGTAGDSLIYHNGMKFSTFDQDNDLHEKNCAALKRGAWWFVYCGYCVLNGKNLNDGYLTEGFNWNHWRGYRYVMKSSTMMFRRRSG